MRCGQCVPLSNSEKTRISEILSELEGISSIDDGLRTSSRDSTERCSMMLELQ